MNQTEITAPDTAAAQVSLPGEMRIAVIEACWHRDIVTNARDAFIDGVAKRGIAADRIDRYDVPGSLEIPLLAQKLAHSGRYAIVAAMGLIVDGGIYRHDFVARSVIDGLMRVQLDTEVPILSVVLTPHHFHDHGDHQTFFAQHFRIKGAEAADACVMTLSNLACLSAAA